MTASAVPDETVLAVSARHRRALADLLGSLDQEALAHPSLCTEWDVRTVAGHVASVLTMNLGTLVVDMVTARGSADRAIDRAARRVAARPVPEIAAILRTHADSRFAIPGVGLRGPMTDVLVHTADIAVPLGLPHDPDPADVRIALDFVVAGRPRAFTTRGRLDGLRLVADDAGFAHGEGAQVRGRGIDVLVAACGRPAVLDRLDGDGVAVLRERLG
ncbi:maleylpyruvate isomerase family mycothiol-dependent enzyme [Pseudonocardia spirodelae]|uniref:Maleylpyruvate isomerase family mycothiol-dependent enzyme n=1 Tax=Pseudonocardia spirodelae TaxID=3133431 RepID=A0ABU8T0N3_9PSEU